MPRRVLFRKFISSDVIKVIFLCNARSNDAERLKEDLRVTPDNCRIIIITTLNPQPSF